MKLAKKLTATVLGLTFCAGMANAGVITGWNSANVTTDAGPYTMYELYESRLYTDDTKAVTNGFIGWEESDVQAPGMKVVNGDDTDGTNCIMTSGYNPEDGSDKMCTDSLKYSKRFKLKADVNAPVQITFDVASGTAGAYKILHKFSNFTELQWDEFTIELGFTVNGEFVASTTADGLGFSDTRGKVFSSAVTSYQSKEDVLSGYFSQGLAGPADKLHPDVGYFDITERMGYGLIATEDTIVSDGITSNYSDLFGAWNTILDVPTAILFDDDADPMTDDLLMGNCQGTFNAADNTCLDASGANGWVTYRELPILVDGVASDSTGVATEVAQSEIDAWIASGEYHTDAIEDLVNLGLTYWVKVDDTSSWPVQNFTMRFTPIPAAATTPDEICDDSIDNDLDGATDCDDSDCAADAACATPTPEVCDDSLDNDQDGAVDCDDSDCTDDAACQAPASEICTDGIDNDGDSYVDCADPDCDGIGTCGAEGRLTTCSDGFDNDGDGAIDCDDSGCVKNKSCK